MRILKEETSAVIIDMQEKLYPHMNNKEKLLQNLTILIQGLKLLNIPVLVTQQYTKGLGPTIPEIDNTLGDYSILEKTAFSCCDENNFMKELKSTGKKNVIITGIESHVCILQTVVDLIEKGFVPILIEDCVSSRKPEDKTIAIERMRSEGAVISTYESIIFELCRSAKTEGFREISKLVK